MKTLKSILIATIVITSMADVVGQSLSKYEKRNNLRNKINYESSKSHKALGNDYSFSKTTGTYADLSGATSINNNQLWDDPEYIIPIGFNFELYDITIDSLYFGIGSGGLVSSKIDINYEAEYFIIPFQTDLIDRGDISGTSQSPISYKVEGTTGNRILKIEWKNAGFYEEGNSLGTLNDYINFQLWLYEGTNDIEIHFGPNMITNPTINYYGETSAIIGLSDYNLLNAYFLSDIPTNPILVDTLDYLNGTPSDGTIYKFSKNSLGIEFNNSTIHTVKIYPNPIQTEAILQTEKNLENAILTIYDSNGKVVKQIANISGKKITLHLDNLPSGLYFSRLTENNKVITSDKLIIKDWHERTKSTWR